MNATILGSFVKFLGSVVYLSFFVILFLYVFFPVLLNIIFMVIFYLVVAGQLKEQKITMKQSLFRFSLFALMEPVVTVIASHLWIMGGINVQSFTKEPRLLFALCFAFNLLFVLLAALRFKCLTRRALKPGQPT